MKSKNIKCQNCGKKLFVFIPRLNISHFNYPMICKHCQSINILKGKPDLNKFDYMSMFATLVLMALLLVTTSLDSFFLKNPFFYFTFVIGIILTNLTNYIFFKRYITSIEIMEVQEAINHLKAKDVSVFFRLPNLLSFRTLISIIIFFKMLSIAIYFNRGEETLIRFLKNPYVYPSLFIGMLLGYFFLLLMKKPLIKSMEKQKRKRIIELEKSVI